MTNDYLLRLVGLGYATTMKAKIQVNQKYVQLELVTGQELGQRLQHRTHTHTHTHTHKHTVLTAIFPGEPGLAGCPLNSPSPFIPGLRILLEKT